MAVRPDTDTKSGAPRPGPQEGELEQYGVWVKAEPQDIAPEPDNASAGQAARRPEPVDALSDESFLSAEEERLLGSFEDIKLEEAGEPLPPSGGFLPGEDFSLPDIEDLSSLAAEGLPPLAEEKLPELSLSELESSLLPPDIGPNAELDMSSIVGLEAEPPLKPEPADQGIEDVTADFFDLKEGEEAAEAGGGSQLDDVTAEFLDLEESPEPQKAAGPRAPAGQEAASEGFEPLDIELHFDDAAPVGQAGAASEAGFEELSEHDDLLATPPPQAGFDDLAALESELAEEPRPRGRAEGGAKAESPSLANELLLQIATELSSIRAELVTLKGQLGAVRLEAAAQAPAAPAGEAEPPREQKAAGGFFDEEEDETIALTGDELDNILSSADFTEEAPPEESAYEVSEPKLAEDLLPETGDYGLPSEAPAIEEVRLEPEQVEPEPALEALREEGFGEIGAFADEGFPPLTEAPEDTSYLEEPLGAEVPLDLGEAPLSEAPLVEPDLSELIVDEIPETEELEISGELPSAEEEALPDISLDLELPAEASTLPRAEEEAAELEALAPIPEIEEFSLDEIKLAEELRHPAEAAPEEALADEAPAEVALSELALPEDFVVEEGGAEEGLAEAALPEDFVVEEAPAAEEALGAEPAFGAEPAPSLGFPEEGLEAPAEVLAEDFLETRTELPLEAPEEFPTEERVEPSAEPRAFEAPLAPAAAAAAGGAESGADRLKSDIRSVLGYLDKLLESLPEEKIEEFAHSEHFETYKKLFEELGLV